jgi:hypothetical protein
MMRSAKLLVIAVLAVMLAGSLFSHAAGDDALEGIFINKITSNGDLTTEFPFDVSGQISDSFERVGNGKPRFMDLTTSGQVTVIEKVPPGWVLVDISCQGEAKVGAEPSTFEFMPGEGVIIHFVEPDLVRCTFTNSPVAPVGGVMEPVNKLSIIAPYLTFFGLIVAFAVVIAEPWKKPES